MISLHFTDKNELTRNPLVLTARMAELVLQPVTESKNETKRTRWLPQIETAYSERQ